MEKFKGIFGKKEGDEAKVKRIRVTRKDLQENILRIKAVMDETPVGTEKYKILQEELDREYVILKKFNESRYVIHPKDAIIIGGVLVGALFFIALDRENPKAIKVASFLLKLFPMKFGI